MAWRAMDVQEQRVRFVVAASRHEKPFGALCLEFGISAPTGRLWIARYAAGGVAGIAERSRRPLRSPAQTPSEQEERVVALRLQYPDWGARKLAILLQQQGLTLTRSTLHRILLRRGLVQNADRHPHATQRFVRERPNELWQMDFKGPKNWPHRIGPLSVIDDHSRFLIALRASAAMDGNRVRRELEQAFERCGLPEGMLMDHGTPWWNWQSFSGRTPLSLWLMRQGIRLCWSGIRHPQTQGKVERFHGSLQRALDRRGGVTGEPQPWLDAFRDEYNQVRPHEALRMQTPATMWSRSDRIYDPDPPAWEYPEGAWTLKVDAQGTVDIQGTRCRIGKTLAGERILIQPVDNRFLIFFCSTLVREIDPSIQRSTIVEHWIERPLGKKTRERMSRDKRESIS
jgi:transposase InsO family protein